MGSELGFRDDLGLGGDSTQGATCLPDKFFLLSFYLEILLLYSYFLINCLVYIFNLLLYSISHIIYSLSIFLVNILLFSVYLIKLIFDVFFNNSIYFSLTYEPSPTLNLLKSPNLKNSSSKFSFLKF